MNQQHMHLIMVIHPNIWLAEDTCAAPVVGIFIDYVRDLVCQVYVD